MLTFRLTTKIIMQDKIRRHGVSFICIIQPKEMQGTDKAAKEKMIIFLFPIQMYPPC